MAYSGYPQDSAIATGSITAADIVTATATGSNASSIYTGTPTAGSVVVMSAVNYNSYAVQVTGIWVGTLQTEASFDNGTTWYRIVPQVKGVSNSAATITANGAFVGEVTVATNIRIRAVAFTSGTATIAYSQSPSSEIVRVDNPIRIFDNTSSQQATIKPASTAPIGADTGLVTTEHPNSPILTSTLTTKGGFAEQAGLTAAALNADLVPSTDVSAYKYLSLQIATMATGGTVSFQGSNDNTTWTNVPLSRIGVVTGAPATNTTASDLYAGPVIYRFFRARLTSYTSGSTTGTLELYTQTAAPLSISGQVLLSGISSIATVDSLGSFSIAANATTGSQINGLNGVASAILQVTTVGVGTLQLQVTADTTNWVNITSSTAIINLTTGAYVASGNITATGLYQISLGGLTGVRVITTAYTSGTFAGSIRIGSGSSMAGITGTPTVTASQGTASSLNATIVGSIAVGATDAGNPLRQGGTARTTNQTAVTDGQKVNAVFDKLGKQVTVQSIRDLKGRQSTTLTSTTTETTIVTAGAAGVFNDVYGLVITNSSATATVVTIRDVTAGGTPLTFNVPAGDTRGLMLPESGAMKQTTAASAWTATCGTSVASVFVTALFVANL